MVKGAC